jgi:hypothetical protein
MAAKTYPIGCECGATIHVPGTSAGTTFTCKCGRQVEIPGLARLKASVGQPPTSPDFHLANLVQAGALPLESDCVLCSVRTDNKAVYLVVCERPEVGTPVMPVWQWVIYIALNILAPWKLFFLTAGEEGAVHGRDVTFRLAVRACETCVQTLTTAAAVRAAMCKTQVYARLFEKFPGSAIRNAD